MLMQVYIVQYTKQGGDIQFWNCKYIHLVLPDQLICIPHRVGMGSDADIHPLYWLELPNETYIFTKMSFD